MHILLVEDDDRIAAALRPALARHGIGTTRLDRGRGAVDHLAGVDVVLLDLGLPDVDGVDVCREIRSASEVPVPFSSRAACGWSCGRIWSLMEDTIRRAPGPGTRSDGPAACMEHWRDATSSPARPRPRGRSRRLHRP